jgi:hypothetical protein
LARFHLWGNRPDPAIVFVNAEASVYLRDMLSVPANFEKGKNNRDAPVIQPAQALYEICTRSLRCVFLLERLNCAPVTNKTVNRGI